MGVAEHINRIRAAGFHIEVEGDQLMVDPFDNLTESQLGWLRSHKDEIMSALLETGQGGHDLQAANDPEPERVTVHVPRMALGNGKAVALDLSVPISRLPELEKALPVQRKRPGPLPDDLVHAALAVRKAYGDSKADQNALLEDLHHYPPGQYPTLIEHFRAKLRPIRCADCAHADIDAGIAKCRAGVDAKLPTAGYWYTDSHPCPWHFQSRDPPIKQ